MAQIMYVYTNQKNSSNAKPSIKPAKDYRVTSGFGYRLNPFPSYHYGMDLAGKANSPIYVTADGVVRQTGWALGYGQAVLVDHSFGYSTLYGHLADIRVKQGETLLVPASENVLYIFGNATFLTATTHNRTD